MEKYGAYRDKGSGIAPFFPIPPQSSNPLFLPWNLFLFCVRVPLVSLAWAIWLLLVQWTTAGSLLRKANLWCILGIPGVWWIDLQVDGVRRGSLSQTPRGRLPSSGTIIASSFTSPLDILYVAAIFDPVFTISEGPDSRLVRPVSLVAALASCFEIKLPPFWHKREEPAKLSEINKNYNGRIIVVFPEATTSNGRAILKLSRSLLSAASNTKIFPISLRYTPQDIVTPIPGWMEALKFVWRLNSRPSHCIRVRIGAPVTLMSPTSSVASPDAKPKSTSPRSGARKSLSRNGIESNFFDGMDNSSTQSMSSDGEPDSSVNDQETRALDAVADTLARLGRTKRVGLGLEEKRGFVQAWSQRGKYRN